MNVTVNDMVKLLDEMAPPKMAESWDNVGLMLGRGTRHVRRILLALDMTDETAEQAVNGKADMLVTHHPAIFGSVNRITDGAWKQELLLRLAEHGIAVYSAHTNLDCISTGVNFALAEKLRLEDHETLDETTGLGRIGSVKTCRLQEFAAFVKKVLDADYLAIGDAGKKVHKVAVCGGAGSDLIPLAIAAGADTLVTGDVKYHTAQEAVFSGLNIIDAGHQPTELPVLESLADRLSLRFAEKDWNVQINIASESLLLRHI